MRSSADRSRDRPQQPTHTTSPQPGKVSRSSQIQCRVSGDAQAGAGLLGTDDVNVRLASQLTGGDAGAPLPGGVRARFEQSLGADLSAVRVHAGPDSEDAARSLGAQAFATGNDIHFGAGKYQPDDPFGLHLLAHEVAHTEQQAGSAPSVHEKLEISQPGDAHEVEADRAAEAMIAGGPASVSRVAGPALARSPGESEGEPTEAEIKAANKAEAAAATPKVAALRAKYDEEFAQAAQYQTEDPDFSDLAGTHGKVADKTTPLTDMAVHQAIQKAWLKVLKKPIPRTALALLFAQWKTEGGNSGIHNNNIGNVTVDVKAGENPISDYTPRSANEFAADGGVGKEKQNYASYATLIQGAMGLIRHMLSNRGAAWMALLGGNVEHYAYVLKSYHYFTAPLEIVRVRGKLVSWGYVKSLKDNMPSFETAPIVEGGSLGIKVPPAEESLPE